MKASLVIPTSGKPVWLAEHRTREGRLVLAEGDTLNDSLAGVAERLIELNKIQELVQ